MVVNWDTFHAFTNYAVAIWVPVGLNPSLPAVYVTVYTTLSGPV